MTRAVRLVRPAGPDHPAQLEVAEVPTPAAGVGEALVHVEVGLLGAADLRGDGGGAPPRTIGREAVGIVAAVGEGVVDWHPGDRVALPALVPCGACGPCRAGRTTLCVQRHRPGRDAPGLLATEVTTRAELLHHVPPELDAAEAAAVPGVVATAYHALKRTGVGPGVTVAVLGADALGLHLTQLAALAGGEVVTVDPRSYARQRALDLGADLVLDPAEGTLAARLVERLGGPVGRIVLTPAGDGTVGTALDLVGPGGRVVVVDRPHLAEAAVPLGRLVEEELDLVGAPGSATAQDVAELFDLAADDRLVLGTTVAGTVDLDDVGEVPPRLHGPRTSDLRVAVRLRP